MLLSSDQKLIIKELIEQCYEYGFSSMYSIHKIAEKVGVVTDNFYNEDEMNGLLWDFGPYKTGYLDIYVNNYGVYATVPREFVDLLENWCR